MSFLDTLLPRFDESWISGCEAIATSNGGDPPQITCFPYAGRCTYAYPSLLDQDNMAVMAEYLDSRTSDMVSRFAVLRYLWAASLAAVPPDSRHWSEDDQEIADDAFQTAANKVLVEFTERLAPDAIATAKQAMWEFQHSFILLRWERIKHLGRCYGRLAGQSGDYSLAM